MASTKTGPSTSGLQVLAIPLVVLLIFFLGYSSQWLFSVAADLAPGPLTARQTVIFNALLLNLWWSYYKACTVDPGSYIINRSAADPEPPPAEKAPPDDAPLDKRSRRELRRRQLEQQLRWCKKCAAPKPPRAHHCRHCRRCIPKMDHHCPWTGNCVSLQTFPYFLRFLVSANAALWYLLHLAYLRFRAVYDARDLPAYLGPSAPALAHLTVVALVCSGVALALAIILSTTVKSWALNRTMIEDWELERHEALLSRHGVRASGGSTWWATDDEDEEAGSDDEEEENDEGNDDDPLLIRRVEFPYDVGVWNNMCQAMGTRNPLAWFWPLAGGPVVSPLGRGTGWDWEENGFNARDGMWPPPDPEKLRRARQGGWPAATAAAAGEVPVPPAYAMTAEEQKAAFRARQEQDLLRRRRVWGRHDGGASGIIAELEEHEGLEVLEDGGGYRRHGGDEEAVEDYDGDEYERGIDGEPGWTNADGDRLRDFGVDEEAEEDDEDDVPLGELIRRRHMAAQVPDR